MPVPEHLRRFPTEDAIESLARRLGLQSPPRMQDWEYEVADSSRIHEFLSLYNDVSLSDDERFTLMGTIIQSFEDEPNLLDRGSLWGDVLATLEQQIDLHIHTVWYWAQPDAHEEHIWHVSPYMREILAAHHSKFQIQ